MAKLVEYRKTRMAVYRGAQLNKTMNYVVFAFSSVLIKENKTGKS